jgi:hypothetical protein
MTKVIASVESWDEEARADGRYRSVWSKFLDALAQPPDRNVEQEIVEYLQRHRYDLPPEVSIELERRHLGP